MGPEGYLCTEPFQSRFSQFHVFVLPLPAKHSRLRWVIEVSGMAGQLHPPAAGGDQGSSKRARNLLTWPDQVFRCLQDLQDLGALSHWGDSKSDCLTSGNPHSSGCYNTHWWTQKLLFSIPGHQLQRLLKFWYLSVFGGLKLLSLSCLRLFGMVSQQTSP